MLSKLIENVGTIKEENHLIEQELLLSSMKLDHIIFKNSAYDAMFEHKALEKLSDHTQCNLGKWYEDEGRREFSGLDSFQKIETPHRDIHAKVKEAMEILKSENLDSKKIKKLFQEVEDASIKLFDLLDTLYKK